MKDNSSLFGSTAGRVGFFGLGRSSLGVMKTISGTDTRIVLRSDKKIPRESIPPCVKVEAIYEEAAAFDNLFEDILILSPSVRRERHELVTARKRGVRLTSDMELFFEKVSSPVFAVSGSDGKSTTATITHLLLGADNAGVSLCGNVGEAMVPHLTQGYSGFVTELSSFMLHYFAPHTVRAAITNVTPNHLDWHEDFDEYLSAKMSLYKNTKEPVVNLDDKYIFENLNSPVYAAVTTELDFKRAKEKISAEVYYTAGDGYILRSGERYIEIEKIRRREPYNVKNIMTSLALTDGRRGADFHEVLRNFDGLAHRCEKVLRWRGIDFINSSIDTSPDRCAATLFSLHAPVVVILGGKGKGVPFTPIREPLEKYGRAAIILGECQEEIIKALPKSLPRRTPATMAEAVELAVSFARPNDTVILSPAATSYDRYKSFEERGDDFKQIVKNYCK